MPTLILEDNFTTGGTWASAVGSPTIVTSPTPPDGTHCLQTNAIGEYVYWNIPDSGYTRIVWGCWLRIPTMPTTNRTRAFKIDSGPSEGWMYVNTGAGRPSIQSDGTPGIAQTNFTTDLLPDTWQWVQLMYDVSANPWELRAKIGSEVISATGAATASNLNPGNLLLGTTSGGDAITMYFGHVKAGVAANDNDWWPTPDSPFATAVKSLTPTSYWRLDDLSDSMAANITLTAVGSPTQVASLVPVEMGAAGAYNLNGTSQYLHAGDVYDLSPNTDWTIAIWVKLTNATTYGTGFRRLLENRDPTAPNAGWLIYGAGSPSPAPTQFDFDNGADGDGHGSATALVDNVVAWLVFTWEGATDTMRVYKDGTLIDTFSAWPVTPTWGAHAGNFTMGASGSGTNQFPGAIDDVAVWSATALNSTQIGDLWTAANIPEGTFTLPSHNVTPLRWR